jgi:hypothetical protein
MFAKLSLDPDFHKNFGCFVGLAPAAYADHMSSPLFKLMIETHLEKVWELLHDNHFAFLGHKEVSPMLARAVSLFPGLVIDVI